MCLKLNRARTHLTYHRNKQTKHTQKTWWSNICCYFHKMTDKACCTSLDYYLLFLNKAGTPFYCCAFKKLISYWKCDLFHFFFGGGVNVHFQRIMKKLSHVIMMILMIIYGKKQEAIDYFLIWLERDWECSITN